jgi:protein phosphatase methylesterase 1
LDKIFLDINLPKLLILAEPERLDKELTIAQMQGKFAFKCPTTKTGHHIHEDAPREVSNFILDFIKAFRLPLSYCEILRKNQEGNMNFKNKFN